MPPRLRLRLRLRRRPALILIFTASEKHPSRVPLCTRALGSSRAPRPERKKFSKTASGATVEHVEATVILDQRQDQHKKKNIRVTEIPYASTRITRKKYRTTPAVPKGHRLLRSPTVCRVFSQSVTRRSASAPLKKTLFLLKRPNRLFRVGHVERTPVSTRPLLGARTRSQAKMSTTDEDPDKVVKNSWTPEVRSIHAPSRSPRARCFRRAWTVKSQGGYFAFAAASGGGSPARRLALDRDRDPEIRASRAPRSPPPTPIAGGRVATRANR